MKKIFNWIIENLKEITFFIMTWGIGWYFFIIIICKISPENSSQINTFHWIILFTSLFLLFLPFVKKIEFGQFFKIEKEVKEAKTEIKNLKSETVERFNLLTNTLTMLSQNLTNNITINNRAPDVETLKEVKQELDEKKPIVKTETDNIDFELNESDEGWIWIFNLLKLRIQIEKELRKSLEKRVSVVNSTNIEDIKFLPISRLFEDYISAYPQSLVFRRPFKVFNSVANAAIHGQIISKQQYDEAKDLGIRILRDIKLNSILT